MNSQVCRRSGVLQWHKVYMKVTRFEIVEYSGREGMLYDISKINRLLWCQKLPLDLLRAGLYNKIPRSKIASDVQESLFQSVVQNLSSRKGLPTCMVKRIFIHEVEKSFCLWPISWWQQGRSWNYNLGQIQVLFSQWTKYGFFNLEINVNIACRCSPTNALFELWSLTYLVTRRPDANIVGKAREARTNKMPFEVLQSISLLLIFMPIFFHSVKEGHELRHVSFQY